MCCSVTILRCTCALRHCTVGARARQKLEAEAEGQEKAAPSTAGGLERAISQMLWRTLDTGQAAAHVDAPSPELQGLDPPRNPVKALKDLEIN